MIRVSPLLSTGDSPMGDQSAEFEAEVRSLALLGTACGQRPDLPRSVPRSETVCDAPEVSRAAARGRVAVCPKRGWRDDLSRSASEFGSAWKVSLAKSKPYNPIR